MARHSKGKVDHARGELAGITNQAPKAKWANRTERRPLPNPKRYDPKLKKFVRPKKS